VKPTNVLKLTLFGLGGFLVAKDFEGPDVPSEVVRERMYRRRRRMVTNATLLLRRLLRRSQHPNAKENGDVEEGSDLEKKDTVQGQGLDQSTMTGTTTAPIPNIGSSNNGSDSPTHTATSTAIELPHNSADHHSSHNHHHDLLSRLWPFLKRLLNPCTVVIILSFVVSLVDPLKALFIPPSSNFQPHFRPTAPDGQPPLAFIFDTATFIGGASIPLGLICLGSALACLSLRSGGPFPKGAIASLTLAKLVVLPIIGVAMTRGFAHVGFVDRNDKVLQFVCMCVVSTFGQDWDFFY
jgi:predicted permease